jgi:hypothetical protein
VAAPGWVAARARHRCDRALRLALFVTVRASRVNLS